MKICSLISIIIVGILPFIVSAQPEPVVLELEDGEIGSDWEVLTMNNVTYVTISTNGTNVHPESADRVITLQVSFPETGTYDLYGRINVGPAGADDDSFFYGNGFGTKSPASEADWIRMNNLSSAGYVELGSVVDGNGNAGANIWKWLNLSEFMGDETPISFAVETANQSFTFQIGAREDGLRLDKLAFALSDEILIVADLDGVDIVETDPIAAGKTKFLGCAYSPSQAPFFTNYWNQVTPENAGKWGSVENSRDNMNWSALDNAYNLAKENGFPYRHHVLIWGNQQPSWIENLSPSEQLDEIEEWFQAVAERYPDIDFLEVVNEPIHDPPDSPGNGGGNYIDALGGAGDSGFDWILESFRLARQYFPNAALAINDYNIINSTPNTNKYLAIINGLMADNLIDIIGIQAHAFSTTASSSIMQSNLDKLAETGLPIHVTEMDIDGPTDQVQLNEYQRIFPLFWEHESVEGITLWGFRPGMWRTEQMAYLIDEDGVTERPALVWLRDYVSETLLQTANPGVSRAIRVYPNPASPGTVRIEGADQIRKIMLFDIQGHKMMEFHTNENAFHLDRNMTPGIYLLHVYNGDEIFVEKMIIQDTK